MLKSMTGYGQAQYNDGLRTYQVEMRSVNHRFCEISIRMPREFHSLEDRMKKKVQEQVKRGRVDVFITIEEDNPLSNALEVNWNLAREYMEIHNQMKETFTMNDSITSLDLMQFPEVLRLNEDISDIESYEQPLLHTVSLASQKLFEMRVAEGKQLMIDLSSRVDSIKNLLEEIKGRAPTVVDDYRQRIFKRVSEFLENQMEVEESRLLTEVALFADRSNIDEELTRLESHGVQFLNTLELVEPVGRKLDFLLQEMNREVNTIGSKANDLVISQKVVELKAELEKMKEQVQNIE